MEHPSDKNPDDGPIEDGPDFDALEDTADQLKAKLEKLRQEFEEVKRLLKRDAEKKTSPDDRDQTSYFPFGWAQAI